MRQLLLLLLLCGCQVGYAQKYSVKGFITDEKAGGLPAATILLLHPKDSSNIYNEITDTKGYYEFKNIIKGEYIFKVSYLGFSTYFKRITVKPEVVILDLGNIKLEPAFSLLNEIKIEGDRSPVVFKKDTVEFNAASFATQPNAAVEDLIKKLPGVEVKDGAVKVQGQDVTKVLVDGKEFFGKDAAIALKNLPADAIDKVQVVDSKTEEAQFTGVDDGKREKVINLQLKKDKRQMGFGKATGGVGSDYRYNTNLNYNRFDKGNQLSVLGMSNNINVQGFSYQDYAQFNGGYERMNEDGGNVWYNNTGSRGVPVENSQQNGDTYSTAGGLNFFQKLNKKLEVNGSYFLNHSDQGIRRLSVTENFLPTGNFLSSDTSTQQIQRMGHTVNFALDYKPDSVNSIKITSSLRYNGNNNTSEYAMQRSSAEGLLKNRSESTSGWEGNDLSGSLRFMYRHRFQKKGRTSSAIFNYTKGQNVNQGLSQIYTWFDWGQEQYFNRDSDSRNANNTYDLNLTYTEPLGKKIFLEGNYNINNNLNNARGEVYDVTAESRRFNDSLSTRSNTDIFSQKVGFSLRKIGEKYNFSVGAGLQHLHNYAEVHILETHEIKRSYLNLLPLASFNYDFSKFKHLSFYYNSYVNAPHYSQLQPIIINTDSLNRYLSNPNLKPSFNHYTGLNLNFYNPVSHISYYLSGGFNYTANPITQAITYDESLVRISQYVNVLNNYSVNLNAHISLPLKKLKSSINIGPNVRYRQGISVLNGKSGQVIQNGAGGNISYNFRYKEKFDFRVGGNFMLQLSTYELNKNQNQQVTNTGFEGEVNARPGKKLHINSRFTYTTYNNPNTNFKQSLPLWNLSVSRFILKQNIGEFKLSALNILDRNLGINLYAYETGVTRSTMNTLGGYYMLSFTYSLNNQLRR